ncbi:MAG: hypothetical protein Q9216_004910, partial [Gyalolechia sp. 2 TL-2023]
ERMVSDRKNVLILDCDKTTPTPIAGTSKENFDGHEAWSNQVSTAHIILDVLPVRIRAQNAAIIFRHLGQSTTLECFEVSSSSHEVISCKGSLRRSFPAHGLDIPGEFIDNAQFCQELCLKLSRLDSETVEEMMPKSRKAGSEWTECRDTCHPALVTEMLTASLAAVSTPWRVLQIRKRIRDDVLWNDCLLPWRRSSLWLILRVSLQTTVALNMEAQEAFIHYKNFMIYFFTAVLGLAWENSTDVELLKIIQMKLARRAAKLGGTIMTFVQEKSLSVCEKVARFLEDTWQEIQRQDSRRESKISIATVKDDIALTLSNCRPALDSALQELNADNIPRTVIPSSPSEWVIISNDGLPVIQKFSVPAENVYALAEFEQWIWHSLPCWLENALSHPNPRQCTSIAASAKDYQRMGSTAYDGCPEQQSLMLLVIGELWHALDAIAGCLVPLLHQYPPGINISHFHTLLLPKKAQMERLHNLETHINARYNNARFPKLSLFAEPSGSDVNCFPSRYYEQSDLHQDLRQLIVANATKRRNEKKEEWQQGMRRYNALKNEYNSISKCEMLSNEYGIEEHSGKCHKCDLQRKMKEMTITVFEWPLPSKETDLRTVVFELSCPAAFAAWRNLTWLFFHDMGRPRETLGKDPHAYLSTYSNLSSYHEPSTSRIVLASSTKSVTTSHYGKLQYPVELEKVSCDHGLQWKFFDSGHVLWLHDQVELPSFSHRCQCLLPDGPYGNLQFTVNSSGHGQNEVLASQSNCSPELNLHEYIAYGSLRADGEKTQWLNICRELRTMNLTWNTEAVFALIRQTAWQVGTASDNFLRTAHDLFRVPGFCEELLFNISNVVTSIQTNRQSVNTMRSLVMILLRILSLGGPDTSSRALSLLRQCRSIIFDWTTGLTDALRTTTSAVHITGIQRNLLRVALLCQMTFDVDIEYISQMMTSCDDIHQWTASAIVVQDNVPGAESLLPTDLRLQLLRDRKLSHTLYRRLQDLVITSDNRGLDSSVLKSWSSFVISPATWQHHGEPRGRWVYKETTAGLQNTSKTVYYDVLSGQLLVDGRPIGKLPKEYTSNKLFVSTFGAQILRVSASDMAGMLYMTVHQEYGYNFHFTMGEDGLVIRAQKDSNIFEIIPRDRFTGDFPTLLVEGFEHWLDVGTGQVEFRPVARKWMPDPENWRLHYRSQGTSCMQNTEGYLVDIRSPTDQNTLSIFGGLDRAEYVHITNTLDGGFEVALPRLGLHFFINNEEDLECRELRKVVDANQSVGTLIGLKSRLVVCAKGDQSKNLDRTVLVPQGQVSTTREGSHLSIRITSIERHVPCLRYQYDPILGRLEGDGTVVSRLYQAYLHALSSYILPDSLTGSLGTEESFKLLDDQSYRCCRPLENVEIDLLDSIATLTPKRVFYPEHFRVMQRVSWHGELGSLSQSSEFLSLAQRILDHAQRLNVFYSDQEPLRALVYRGDPGLLQRAKLRNSAYQNVDYGSDVYNTDNDVEYKGRDGSYDVNKAARACAISSLVVSWSSNLAITSEDLVAKWTSCGTMDGFDTDFDLSVSISDLHQLSFKDSWAKLYRYCRQATKEKSQHELLFILSNIAYGSSDFSLGDLKLLLAFATNASLKDLPSFPNHKSFTLRNGSGPDRAKIRSAIGSCEKPWPGAGRNTSAAVRRQRHAEYQRESSSNISDATDFCVNQWPSQDPSPIPSSCHRWLTFQDADCAVRGLFAEWHKNRKCENHLRAIEGVLNTFTRPYSYPTYESHDWHQMRSCSRPFSNQPLPTFTALITTKFPVLPGPMLHFSVNQHMEALGSSHEIRSLVISSSDATSTSKENSTRKRYKGDLLASLDAFDAHLEMVAPTEISISTIGEAMTHFERWKCSFSSDFKQLFDILEPNDPLSHLLKAAGLWPRLRKRDLLHAIASHSHLKISQHWKQSIIAAGEAITILQRARRLVLAAESHDSLSFFKEVENPGRLGWSAYDRPDWLLMEIENDLLIRKIQARVALEMIDPSSSCNTLMQLNMGEGKSSVIIPLIAAALADGQQLSRVVVLRSLTRQMQDTLIRRLGGLAKRPIYCIPFSRNSSIDEETLEKMRAIYAECMTSGGILIIQPEHMLSFKLMGIERLVSEQSSVATKLLETQAWLDTYSRDVLDESDEILDVKFQLIYTLGNQRNMDGQPDRWLMMEGVFDIVQYQADILRRLCPDQIEVEKYSSASFPTIRLLSSKTRQQLISQVFEDICDSKIPGLVMSNLPSHVEKAARSFIADTDVAESDCNVIESYCADDETYLKKLLFVRGLIAGGILLHALHAKRWSVTYGLHPTRCLCAVPYRAKGVPAPTAEFGHPDVTIALTCLSYYYTGLKDSQIRTCLEILQKADDPTAEYGTWTKADRDFPRQSCHWNAVNLEDQQQCIDQLFPALRYNKKTADFFLANVVFPKEGKEFDQKLSTSGWDIPASPGSMHITTGFSGTNDNRFLLPSSIAQSDLPELRHTSGKVLQFVSRPENRSYFCAKDAEGIHLSSEELLRFVTNSDPSVRVLIDVGAQILDLKNDQVIRKWLELVPDADAGIYFDEQDHAVVLTRAGKKEKLITSSFSNRMDRCIVYLDDVHTRGTDLKLPQTARAAVTLGPRLTKDRLVQACMRLRQLGHGQSLMFVSPPEVHQEIVKNSGISELNGLHVIGWALEQSCLQIERNQPLRVIQGLNFYDRTAAMDKLRQCLVAMSEDNPINLQDLAQRLIEHEAQSLHELYAPEAMREEDETDLVYRSRSKPDQDVQDLITLWDQIDLQATRGARMHEEHEREVAQEVEQETQVERPPGATPESRRLDKRLATFIRLGTMTALGQFPAVHQEILKKSCATVLLKGRTKVWNHLRVSLGFVRAVKHDKASSMDDFIRPVHWLLVSKEAGVRDILLISQYEVNVLLDQILNPSSRAVLVCYEPRVSRSMVSLDMSTSHPLPSAKEAWESISQEAKQQLHLFAGQLYFTTYADYEHYKGQLNADNTALLGFVKEWMGIRRKGQNYLQSHMGQVVSGRVLHPEMFE